MQRARPDVIVASCICVVFLSATITVAANAKSRKVSAAEIIVLSDDIHKQTTQVEHSGDNPSGVEAGEPKGEKSKGKESKGKKSKGKSKSKSKAK